MTSFVPATRAPQLQQKASPEWSFTPQNAQYTLAPGAGAAAGGAVGAFIFDSGPLGVEAFGAGCGGPDARGSASNTVWHSSHRRASSATNAPQIGQT